MDKDIYQIRVRHDGMVNVWVKKLNAIRWHCIGVFASKRLAKRWVYAKQHA